MPGSARIRGLLQECPASPEIATLNGKRFKGALFHTTTISSGFCSTRHSAAGVLLPGNALGFGADQVRPPSRLLLSQCLDEPDRRSMKISPSGSCTIDGSQRPLVEDGVIFSTNV